MSISADPQLAHKLVMADLTIQDRLSCTASALAMALARAVVLALAFQVTAVLGALSPWPAGLAAAAVLRLMLLVLLTRAVFRCGEVGWAALRLPGLRSEILREDSPI